MSPFRALVVVGLTVLPLAVHAQAVEPEWRVINATPPKVIPLYAGGENPFPQIAEENAPQPTVAQPQNFDAAAEEAKMNLANALAKARSLIGSDRVYQPDLSGIRFGGRVVGDAGPKVFFNGQWVGTGKTIVVPVKGVAEAYEAIQRLEELDPELARSVSEELSNRISNVSTETLKITAIGESNVTLTGSAGKKHVISLSRSGW